MQKIYFGYAMNFFKKGMALSLLIFLGLPVRAQDGYEPNDTKETATPLTATFTGNTSTIDISSASCHVESDVDFYKIELPPDAFYIFSGVLYDKDTHWPSYTLDVKASYSTDGSAWSTSRDKLPRVTVPGGTLYLKIQPHNSKTSGTYAARIDLSIAAAVGCTYALPTPASRTLTAEAGANQQIAVTTGEACLWAATSNVGWITLTAQSGTGSGNVIYSYTENATADSRTGTITVAGQPYTVTQASPQPDGYEENNTVANAKLLSIPTFAQNASTIINILSVNCHIASDVDYYKIELPAGASYIFSAELYDKNNRLNDSAYTLDAKISYSTDNGVTWSATADSRLPRTATSAGTLYLKIEPNFNPNVSSVNIGTYSAKIDLRMVTTAGCTYTLPTPASLEVTADAATNQQITLTATGTTCSWEAVSNVGWITLAAESGTGSGSVSYSYTGNTTADSRTGILTIAGQTYTVTQAPPQADSYEENNTKETAALLTATFIENASTINISPASCHVPGDVDFYKIELPAGASYIFSGELYDAENRRDRYTVDVLVSYSTDGSTWTSLNDALPRTAMSAGTLYLKILPGLSRQMGTYAAKIDLRRATTAECTYTLAEPTSLEVTAEAGANQQIAVTTGEACPWAAISNVGWITITSESGTGSGNVSYSYTGNTTASSRTGILTIADKTYTVTQAALQPDGYEPNNTVADANLLSIPPFTQNASTIDISSANCHDVNDVDIYKIELPAGVSYIFSAELYDKNNQRNNSAYTLDAKMSYSTDNGVTWSATADSRLPRTATSAGTLYLKIVPGMSRQMGTYAAKIDLRMAATAECTYTLPTPASLEVTADAATNQQITLTATGTTCSWEAVSNVGWITLVAESGTGSGNVIYSYTENATADSRMGIITVAGQAYTVTQAPPLPDSYEENNTKETAALLTATFIENASTINISPASCHVPGDVDFYKIELPVGVSYIFSAELYDKNNQRNNSAYTLDAKISYSTDNGVTWSATADSRLPRMQAPAGTLYLKIVPSLSRQMGTYAAKIDIVALCAYEVPSSIQQVAATSAIGQVEVRTTAICTWTAVSNAPWITIPAGQTLVGTKNLNFSYEANPTREPRTGTMTVAGQTVTVTQAGAVCSYTLSPTSMAVFSAAGTGKVSVRAAFDDCVWTAIPNAPWITIPTGQTLVGTKELNFSYEANPTNEPREGTITIAGETFTVRQSSVTTGFETASPVKIFPNPAKDFVTIEVSSSDQEWVSLKITNVFGQTFYERTNPEHKMQIPLTGFSSGLYFIMLQGKEKTAVQKLIIE